MDSIAVFLTVAIGRGWRWCVDCWLQRMLGQARVPGPFLIAELCTSLLTGIIIGALPVEAYTSAPLYPFVRLGFGLGYIVANPFSGEITRVEGQEGTNAALAYKFVALAGVPVLLFAGFFVGQSIGI